MKMTAAKVYSMLLGALLWVSMPMTAAAQSSITEKACQKDWDLVEQMTRTCWDCFFPFTIIGIPIGKTSKLPDDRNKSPICVCPGRTGYPSIGFTLGWWAPDHTIEMVRQPWCMPSLGGFVLTNDKESGGGGVVTPGRWGGENAKSDGVGDEFYMNFHWYKFPIGYLLSWLSDYVCSKKSSTAIDIAFMSELDPSWNNDALAIWVGPEAKIFSAPWAIVACSADAAMATVRKPLKSLYYCAGSWGKVFPMAGSSANQTGLTTNASLTATRGLAKMHRFGIAERTYGTKYLCANGRRFVLEKQQYRIQLVFPLTEASNGRMSKNKGSSNHWIGASTFRWGGEFSTPPTKEDYIFLQWGFQECCVTLW